MKTTSKWIVVFLHVSVECARPCGVRGEVGEG